ncbi:MAG: AbrB family transcriptional regulator [Comamonadaceae bacterium]|nr:AbrB family transcriptional regulator [Comamonadaceae bacterium]
MQTVTVSVKGQVVVPTVILMAVKRQRVPAKAEDGFGMLVCKKPGQRRLADFDVTAAMRLAANTVAKLRCG